MLLGCSEQGLVYVFDQPVRILAADDDPLMREFAASQLAHPGGEIVTAEDGEQAWAILEADETGFDLVLSDLEMPRMTGFSLCEAIRGSARHAHLPVVVITGRDDMFAIDRAYEVGATAFATKPVNWRLLGYQLRYVMRASREAQPGSRTAAEAVPACEKPRSLVEALKILAEADPQRLAATQSELDPADTQSRQVLNRLLAGLTEDDAKRSERQTGPDIPAVIPDPHETTTSSPSAPARDSTEARFTEEPSAQTAQSDIAPSGDADDQPPPAAQEAEPVAAPAGEIERAPRTDPMIADMRARLARSAELAEAVPETGSRFPGLGLLRSLSPKNASQRSR